MVHKCDKGNLEERAYGVESSRILQVMRLSSVPSFTKSFCRRLLGTENPLLKHIQPRAVVSRTGSNVSFFSYLIL